MLRYLAGALFAVMLAFPASAAVMIDPTDPEMSSAVVFSADAFKGNIVGGEFELSQASVVSATMSAVGSEINLSMFEISSGAEVLATGTVLNPTSTTAFASILDVKLPAGTYVLSASGDFHGALSGQVAATVIPLPGGILLLGTAMAGLGLYRRYRKPAAA